MTIIIALLTGILTCCFLGIVMKEKSNTTRYPTVSQQFSSEYNHRWIEKATLNIPFNQTHLEDVFFIYSKYAIIVKADEIAIIGCKFNSCDVGILLEKNYSNIFIMNCIFLNCSSGIISYANNVTIAFCLFVIQTENDTAIRCYGEDSYLMNNTINITNPSQEWIEHAKEMRNKFNSSAWIIKENKI
jgi:hypothetical protein